MKQLINGLNWLFVLLFGICIGRLAFDTLYIPMSRTIFGQIVGALVVALASIGAVAVAYVLTFLIPHQRTIHDSKAEKDRKIK